VQNTSDGKVIGEAQGSADDVKKFVADLNDGPEAAHVVRVEKEAMDALPEDDEATKTFEKR
jgi:acylphosphatase